MLETITLTCEGKAGPAEGFTLSEKFLKVLNSQLPYVHFNVNIAENGEVKITFDRGLEVIDGQIESALDTIIDLIEKGE